MVDRRFSVIRCTVNARNVIIVWSSVQCETVYSAVNGQAGTLWMKGIMWPQHLPKQIFLTDCQQAHTRDQPIKITLKRDSKRAKRARKHSVYNIQYISVHCANVDATVTPFFRRFYEWRLWYVNECDWEKEMASSAFQRGHCCNLLDWFSLKERLDWNTNVIFTILIHDYVPKSWRTTVTHRSRLSMEGYLITMY